MLCHPAIRAIADQRGAESTRGQYRQRARIHAPSEQATTKRILNELPRSNQEGSGANTCSAASRFTASADFATGNNASTKPVVIVAA